MLRKSHLPRGSVHHFGVTSTEEGVSTDLMYPHTDTKTLSALLLSLVVSAQPTADRPLTMRLDTEMKSAPSWLDVFRNWVALSDDKKCGSKA